MRILIAPDSFKGSLSAVAAAEAMRRGCRRVFPEAEYDLLPAADGGEGTTAALVKATRGTLHSVTVSDPLGRPVMAQWGLLGDGRTAVVETAAASGLPLVAPDERNPMGASSRGTGELLLAALAGLRAAGHEGTTAASEAAAASGHGGPGPARLILGLGGSATNDAGAGLLSALGIRFFGSQGEELSSGGAALARLERIDAAGATPLLDGVEILAATDVDNPLCGPAGASFVFGPQKGASVEEAVLLDAALQQFAQKARETTGRDAQGVPGAGAAGGIGAGLLFFTRAVLRPGIDLVLETAGFEARAARADLVLTGEGLTDSQTARGKAPLGVARAAKGLGKPVLCISGGLGGGARELYALGVDGMASAVCAVSTLEAAMERAGPLLEDAAERAMRLLATGMNMGAFVL